MYSIVEDEMVNRVLEGYTILGWPEFRDFCRICLDYDIDIRRDGLTAITGVRVDMSPQDTHVTIWRHLGLEVYRFYAKMFGIELYAHPVFKALGKRLGFVWDLWTIEQSFVFKESEMPRIVQTYNPVDNGPDQPAHEADDGE